MYERRLKTEFEYLQMLQKSEAKSYVTIRYKERLGRQEWKPILSNPESQLYPNQFQVTYNFPKMYVGRNKTKRNWHGTINFTATEDVLMRNGSMPVGIEGGGFPVGEVPYNNHVTMGFICTGSAWQIAKQGYGIWYFIICIGSLLNLEPLIIDDTNPRHLNEEAYNFWVNELKKQPTNKIKWPFDLNSRKQSSTTTTGGLRIGQRVMTKVPNIRIGKRTN